MATPNQFQERRGTTAVTFTQTGTWSSVGNLGGMRLVGMYSHNYPAAAGSVTFRSSWDSTGGTHYPVMTELGVPFRMTAFGSGTFYSFTPGTVPAAAQYVTLEIGTAGTAGIAAGGTIILVGEVL
jgi:hypothetical protein